MAAVISDLPMMPMTTTDAMITPRRKYLMFDRPVKMLSEAQYPVSFFLLTLIF